MSKKLHILKVLILNLIIGFLPLLIEAQVTIGSNLDPSPLTLLNLQEKGTDPNNANSTRGLSLPRIKLTDTDNLYPMFETSPGSNTPIPDYQGANKSIRDTEHIGLVVYNVNICNGFGPGSYVWVGDQWEPLGPVNVIQKPDIDITNPSDPSIIERLNDGTYLIHYPSGKDLRSFPADNKFSLTLQWQNSNGGNLTIPDISTLPDSTLLVPGPDGGLNFTSNPPNVWATPPITISPVIFDHKIDDMSDIITSDNAQISNPFRSRETIVTFNAPANECYGAEQIKVRLNQTNYRLTPKKDNPTFNQWGYQFRKGGRYGTGTHYYRLLATVVNESIEYGDGIDLELQSNAQWKSTLSKTNFFSEVFTNFDIPATGGQEIIDGTTPPVFYRSPTRVSNANDYGTRDELTATVKFEDAAASARFYPVIIDFVQCSSDKYDDDDIEDVGRGLGPWDPEDILRHTDQSGNIFYSATFGNARWMITNLAATEYDTDSEVYGSKTLIKYDNTPIEDHANGKGKYAYPQTESDKATTSDWGTPPTDWRPTEGLFYNWYAVTGRGFQDNGNEEEGNTDQSFVQGICPNGWHIPSDKEWNILEEQVHSNIPIYAAYDKPVLDEYLHLMQPWKPEWNTAEGERGDWILDGAFGHGAAMKEICGIKGQKFYWMLGTKNYSLSPREGGFNAMLAGRIKTLSDSGNGANGNMQQEDRSANGDYWSLSQHKSPDASANSNTAWIRGFSLYGSTVLRDDTSKSILSSVRCVKD